VKLAEHDPQGSVGFPLGSTPDESFANMMTFLKNAAAKRSLIDCRRRRHLNQPTCATSPRSAKP